MMEREASAERPGVSMLMRFIPFLIVAAVAVPARAQGRGGQPPQAPPAAGESAGPREEFAGAAEEKISQTSHTIRVDGREIKYTATAGTLPIRLDNGQVVARMFFVAYTKDGEDAKMRPVSFLYNGGPGAATIWLHMGSFAPKHVRMADEGFQPAPPYTLEDNENSLVDVSDLVFVDAISTGYSRTTPGNSSQQFHGQSGDLRAFGEFINVYLKTYNRWPSPKYLIGESYGTIRSAGLAQEIQDRHGIELNGIVLVSSLLTYQTLSPAPDNDVAYASLIETFAADAWYHKKLPADRQGYDISNSALQGPYTSMFQEYVKNDLKWETDLHYPTSGNVRPWTYDQNRYMDMTEPLRSAMTHNPFLKVFVAIGYYDMATIMGGAEFNFTHLAYDKQVTDRVSHGYYEAGHMIYIRPSAHKALKNDVAKFIQGTRAQGASRTTSQP